MKWINTSGVVEGSMNGVVRISKDVEWMEWWKQAREY